MASFHSEITRVLDEFYVCKETKVMIIMLSVYLLKNRLKYEFVDSKQNKN